MSDLSSFTTETLKQEVERREKIIKEQRALSLKEKEVKVTCPTCGGSGIETYFNMEVAVGADSGQRTCLQCKGAKFIVAHRL